MNNNDCWSLDFEYIQQQLTGVDEKQEQQPQQRATKTKTTYE